MASKYEELECLYAAVGKVIYEGLTNYEKATNANPSQLFGEYVSDFLSSGLVGYQSLHLDMVVGRNFELMGWFGRNLCVAHCPQCLHLASMPLLRTHCLTDLALTAPSETKGNQGS